MEKKRLFLILLILGTSFWGISFPVTKLTLGDFSQSTFLFYRFMAATLVLSLVFWKHVKQLTPEIIKSGALLAIPLEFGIYFQTMGIKLSPAGQTAFIAGICVVIIPFIKIFYFKASISLKIWIAALLALLGLGIISITQDFKISLGDIYTLIGAFGFSIYLINVENYSKKKPIIPTITPMFFFCALFTYVLALLDTTANWFPESPSFWMGIAYAAVFTTAYMYTISNLAQQYISAEKVGIIYLLEPVFAAIAAFFILGESLTWKLFWGGLLIVLATIISEVKFKKQPTLKAR